MSRVSAPEFTAHGDLHARTAERSRAAVREAAERANRRRAWPRWARPALRGAMFGLPVLVLAGTGLWAVKSGAAAALGHGIVEMSTLAGLSVNQVLVQGRIETAPAAILSALDVHRGTPILAFDPEQARKALEQLPWIKSAVVERRLPDTLYVRITERKPIALWQNDHKMVVVDADGVVLTGRDLQRFARLPLLVGPDAPAHARAGLQLIASVPTLAPRITAMTWVGDRRWDLHFHDGVDVRLPETGAAAALQELAALEQSKQLLERDIVAVDLRLADRLVVQVAPDAAVPSHQRHAPEHKS